MRKICTLGVLLLVACSTVFSAGYFRLDWSDEFDGDRVDENKWEFQMGRDDSGKGNWAWGNDEKQYYHSQTTNSGKNIIVKDGVLTIRAIREAAGQGASYTSARMTTRNKYFTTFGRIEARIKFDNCAGAEGVWPAFWMMPEKSEYGGWPHSGEIDIMEMRGRTPTVWGGTIHYGRPWPQNEWNSIGDQRFANGSNMEDWHVFAVEWKLGEFMWYCDGVKMGKTINSGWNCGPGKPGFPAPFDKDFNIILNMAVGGNFDGGREPRASWQYGDMRVDYVRVYKWDDNLTQKQIPQPDKNPAPLPPPGGGQNTRVNLALNKPATASSNFNHPGDEVNPAGPMPATNVTDGKLGTRWGSTEDGQRYTKEWLQIDLESVCNIEEVSIDWEGAFAVGYEIQVSTDGQVWSNYATKTNNNGTATSDKKNVSARYVKINMNEKTSPWQGNYYGYSIFEVSVYGNTGTQNINQQSVSDIAIRQAGNEIFILPSESIQSVGLYSINGQLVLSQASDVIQTSGIAKGIYILKVVEINGNQKIFKVII